MSSSITIPPIARFRQYDFTIVRDRVNLYIPEVYGVCQEELVRAGVLPPDYDFDAHKSLVPMQPGDVPVTYADNTALERDYGFRPEINIRQGLRAFAEWYKAFYMS